MRTNLSRPQQLETKKCVVCGNYYRIQRPPKGVRFRSTPYLCRRCGGHNPTERPVDDEEFKVKAFYDGAQR